MNRLLSIPFATYYADTEFHALTEMSRKSLLAFPLGVLLTFSWPAARRQSAVRLRTVLVAIAGLIALSAIELGQVLLPTRTPDVTDILVGEAGLLCGAWVARLLGASTAGPANDSATGVLSGSQSA
jgi:glycopeptide antibiotics resistance protein